MMSLFPNFQFSWLGGWWFSALFLLSHLIMGLFYPQLRKRVMVRPKSEKPLPRVTMLLGFLLFQSRIILAVFIPLSFRMPFFVIGAVFASGSFILYIAALLTYVKSPMDRPVTGGVYRLTRNPQQIFSIIFWTSVGFMLGTALFPLLGLLEFFLAYPGFIAQEEFCQKKYGEDYNSYMASTPRYLLF